MTTHARTGGEMDGMALTTYQTVLTGMVIDQAAPHELLQRIPALGLRLVDVRALARPDVDDGAVE
jgi:hypothetical protein